MRKWVLIALLLGGCASSRPYTFGERPKPARHEASDPGRQGQEPSGSVADLIYAIVGMVSPKTIH